MEVSDNAHAHPLGGDGTPLADGVNDAIRQDEASRIAALMLAKASLERRRGAASNDGSPPRPSPSESSASGTTEQTSRSHFHPPELMRSATVPVMDTMLPFDNAPATPLPAAGTGELSGSGTARPTAGRPSPMVPPLGLPARGASPMPVLLSPPQQRMALDGTTGATGGASAATAAAPPIAQIVQPGAPAGVGSGGLHIYEVDVTAPDAFQRVEITGVAGLSTEQKQACVLLHRAIALREKHYHGKPTYYWGPFSPEQFPMSPTPGTINQYVSHSYGKTDSARGDRSRRNSLSGAASVGHGHHLRGGIATPGSGPAPATTGSPGGAVPQPAPASGSGGGAGASSNLFFANAPGAFPSGSAAPPAPGSGSSRTPQPGAGDALLSSPAPAVPQGGLGSPQGSVGSHLVSAETGKNYGNLFYRRRMEPAFKPFELPLQEPAGHHAYRLVDGVMHVWNTAALGAGGEAGTGETASPSAAAHAAAGDTAAASSPTVAPPRLTRLTVSTCSDATSGSSVSGSSPLSGDELLTPANSMFPVPSYASFAADYEVRDGGEEIRAGMAIAPRRILS